MGWLWVLWIIILIFGIIFILKTFTSIAPYQRWVKERLSQFTWMLDPGWHFLIPFIDKVTTVDVREKVFNTWSHEMITKDNAVVTVDAVVYMQVTDAKKAVYDIQDPYNAVLQIALANLRSMIWQLILDESLSERWRINTFVQTHLSDETAKWWVKVTKVEIQRIEPPADLTRAMQEQKKAEQEKRAQILRAEWQREAAIREAEWIKEKQIIEAQWFREKQILEAQWKAEAIERMASAKAKTIELESNAAITYFKDNAVLKEQLRVFEESMKTNSKYVIDSSMFDFVKWLLIKK